MDWADFVFEAVVNLRNEGDGKYDVDEGDDDVLPEHINEVIS